MISCTETIAKIFQRCMLSEAYQRVATLQLGSNCCSFIAIFDGSSLNEPLREDDAVENDVINVPLHCIYF